MGRIAYFYRSLLVSLFFCAVMSGSAQNHQENYAYERSSLYMMMVKHPQYAYNKEIEHVFSHIRFPERFNDHSLSNKSVIFSSSSDDLTSSIQKFLDQKEIGRRLVSKWFHRTKEGAFDMSLIKERGLYNATVTDWKMASLSHRNKAVLEDAGENLIDNTYVVINDIRYINRSTAWNSIKDIASAASGFAAGMASIFVVGTDVTGFSEGNQELGSEYAWLYGQLTDKIKGFAVNVTSYLFRLRWDEETANRFYQDYYMETEELDAAKADAYVKNSGPLFQMEYVGQVENKSSKTVLSGIRTNEELIRKVCTRALDKNIADLQHEFSDFRIKAPLVSVSPLRAYIGMKEDVTENSRYEVLEREATNDGRILYKRVGIIKPVKDQIWDNRFMAVEEQAENATIDGTTFEIVSGKNFLSGMLIREIE